VLLDLACRIARYLRDAQHSRGLVVSDQRSAVLAELFDAESRPGYRGHDGDHRLAPDVIRFADDRAIDDLWMLDERLLHLGRIDGGDTRVELERWGVHGVDDLIADGIAVQG
jgi:hypothetical protein